MKDSRYTIALMDIYNNVSAAEQFYCSEEVYTIYHKDCEYCSGMGVMKNGI